MSRHLKFAHEFDDRQLSQLMTLHALDGQPDDPRHRQLAAAVEHWATETRRELTAVPPVQEPLGAELEM